MLLSRAALYLEEVVRRGSLRRASETLNISASAIDRQILMLERHIGAPLFDRLPNGLRLTRAGEMLTETVRNSRSSVERARSLIEALHRPHHGKAIICASEGVSGFLVHALRSLSRSQPHIEFVVRVVPAGEVTCQLLRGAADIGFVFNPLDAPALKVERTISCKIGAVLPIDHDLAGETAVSLSDCADFPLLLPDDSLSLRRSIDRAWEAGVGHPLVAAITTNSVEMMKRMVLEGLGIAFLTDIDVFTELQRGKVRFLPLRDKRAISMLSILRVMDRTLNQAGELLIRHLLEAQAILTTTADGIDAYA